MHDIEFAQGDIPLPLSFVILFLVTFVPIFVGYYLSKFFRNNKDNYDKRSNLLIGLTLGVILFIFYDFSSQATFFSFGGSDYGYQFLLITVFLGTFIAFFVVDLKYSSLSPVMYLWALALGLHGIAEGLDFGFNLAQELSVIIVFFPVLSFLIHKFSEGFTGVVFFEDEYPPRRNQILILSIIAGIPPIIGLFIGYIGYSYDIIFIQNNLSSYLYAASIGAIVFIIPKVMEKYSNSNRDYKQLSLWFMIGLLFLTLSGLLHNIDF